ncbi:MAG: hypothetical protein PVG03_08030 [Desulfarculaceae bacterium]|jgi:hypothetical protein
MSETDSRPEIISLKDIISIYGLPTLPELMRDGLNPGPELYRALVIRLVRHYLGAMLLDLEPVDEEHFRLFPEQGNQWEDVAFWLGHVANLKAGEVLIGSVDDLLSLGAPEGGSFADLGQAVRANLELLGEVPFAFNMGLPDQALRKAVKYAQEAEKVRGAG